MHFHRVVAEPLMVQMGHMLGGMAFLSPCALATPGRKCRASLLQDCASLLAAVSWALSTWLHEDTESGSNGYRTSLEGGTALLRAALGCQKVLSSPEY